MNKRENQPHKWGKFPEMTANKVTVTHVRFQCPTANRAHGKDAAKFPTSAIVLSYHNGKHDL